MPSAVEHLLDEVDLAAELVGGRATGWPCTRGTSRRGRSGARRRTPPRVGGLLVAQQVDQHRGEPVDRVGGLPVRRGEVLGRQRVERPVGQRMAVQQEQARG